MNPAATYAAIAAGLSSRTIRCTGRSRPAALVPRPERVRGVPEGGEPEVAEHLPVVAGQFHDLECVHAKTLGDRSSAVVSFFR